MNLRFRQTNSIHYFLFTVLIIISLGGSILGCQSPNSSEDAASSSSATSQGSQLDTATFAGGCFWCIEASFEQIQGVKEAVSGYAGGEIKDPSYDQVSRGATDYAETVQIYYDPAVITYKKLLAIFFTAHDPTQLNRQGPDVGRQYRSAIFYHNDRQKRLAEKKITQLNNSNRYEDDIVTELNPYNNFYKAAPYHQNYEKKHPNDSYIRNVSRPKINKVRERFPELLKN